MEAKNIKISGLSNFEADILNIIWDSGENTVGSVHLELLRETDKENIRNKLPYTTVMSSMIFMAQKGLLKRDRSSRAHIYSANVTRKHIAKSIIKSVADKILS